MMPQFDGPFETTEQKIIETENQLNPGNDLMKQKAKLLKYQLQTILKTKYKHK